MVSPDPDDRNEGPEFASALSRLKERGCALLITGEVGCEVSKQMSRQLFGAPSMRRRRMMGVTSEADTDAWFPTSVPTEAGVKLLTVVDVDANRSAAAAQTPVLGDRPGIVRCQERLLDGIDAVRGCGEPLDPAELRVGFYSALDLLEQYPTDEVRSLLTAVTDRVVAEDGIAHVHLPCADDDDAVEELQPLFDGRIELRQRHDDGLVVEQRWHLPSYGTTKWIRL